jgi:hypothetical protein
MAKILIVEDNEMNRDMLSRRLARRGYALVSAALAATARLPEDVVIAQPLRHAYFGPARGWCDTAIIPMHPGSWPSKLPPVFNRPRLEFSYNRTETTRFGYRSSGTVER